MRYKLFVVILLLVLTSAFSQAAATKSKSKKTNQRRLEVRVKPFIDLYFFVYKFASSSEQPPVIEGFAQAVDAARHVPIFLPLTDLALFRCDNAKDAERAFAQFPETQKLRNGEVIPLRQRAVHLAQTLAVIERPFAQRIWPQHRVAIQQAESRIAQSLEPREREIFAYFTSHLGMDDSTSNYVVPVYLVAEGPWPAAFTAQGKASAHGMCLVNVGATQGSKLFEATLHEAIHALDFETKDNALTDLRSQLLKAGFDQNDFIVREAPHLLVFIQSVETVRRFVDASYDPYAQGVFARAAIQPLTNIVRPIWTAYLDGKLSREHALNQIVDGFIKARKDAPAKTRPN